MKRNLPETDMLLDLIRDGRPMTLRQQLRLTIELSVPAIIAQLSSIIMQYIDAAMVGRIGAKASASIGLVSTTTWQFAAGHIGRGYQFFAAGMAGRRCLHPSGRICLFFHLFHFFARPADDFSGRRHAAL